MVFPGRTHLFFKILYILRFMNRKYLTMDMFIVAAQQAIYIGLILSYVVLCMILVFCKYHSGSYGGFLLLGLS